VLFGGVVLGTAGATGTNEATLVKSDTVQAVAQVQSLDRFQAEQERLRKQIQSKPKAYEDKVMETGSLPADIFPEDAPPNAVQTGFRSYSVESRYGFAESNGAGVGLRASEWGLRTELRQETFNFGEWVLQADTRSGNGNVGTVSGAGWLGYDSDRSASRLTVRNLGFPITPRIFADTSVGDIYSEVTDAFSRGYRLSLGNSSVRGLGTRVFGSGFDLRAGTGMRSYLVGSPFPGFEHSQGSLSWIGYTQRLSGNMYAGLQVNRASDVPALAPSLYFSPYGVATGAPLENIGSMGLSFGYGHDLFKDGDSRFRVMLMRSQVSGSTAGPRDAKGVFIEAGYQAGRYRHEFGMYAADPNLRSGDYTLASDNRGAYWRVDHNTSRINWGGSIDYEQQNPDHDPTRFGGKRLSLNANAQYRINRDTTVGANASLSNARYDTTGAYALSANGLRSVNASIFYQTRLYDWGRTRFSATVRRNETLVANGIAATGDEFQWEHDWITGKYETQRPEFTTTLGLAHDRSTGTTQTYPTAGLLFRYWTDSAWSLNGNLRYTSRSGELSTSRGLSGTLSTEYRLGSGWQAGASVSLNQAVLNVSGSSFFAPQVIRSNDKSVYVYLRWDGSSGAPLQAAGLRSTAGGGSISGTVYLDANRDGEQQPGEAGVANVEVLLDNRYRITTDRNGRFEFPVVATGSHQLTLNLESVPLPWGAASDQGMNVEVPLRGQATARIPVVRVGG